MMFKMQNPRLTRAKENATQRKRIIARWRVVFSFFTRCGNTDMQKENNIGLSIVQTRQVIEEAMKIFRSDSL